ncbi:MAG: hypothetical protein RL186_395 [Pseudomonadota bacterium]
MVLAAVINAENNHPPGGLINTDSNSRFSFKSDEAQSMPQVIPRCSALREKVKPVTVSKYRLQKRFRSPRFAFFSNIIMNVLKLLNCLFGVSNLIRHRSCSFVIYILPLMRVEARFGVLCTHYGRWLANR